MDEDKKILEQIVNSDIVGEIRKTINAIQRAQMAIAKLVNSDDQDSALKLRIGTVLTSAILSKIIAGKKPKDFTEEDWKEIANTVVDEAVLIDEQTYTENVFLFYADYIDASASLFEANLSEEKVQAIHKLANDLRNQTEALTSETIAEAQYVERCLWISLEAMIKVISATIALKAVPEVAKLIDGASSYALQYGRLVLYRKEQWIINEYLANQKQIDNELGARHEAYTQELEKQARLFQHLIDTAFAEDFAKSLQGSIELARKAGVVENELLHNLDEADEFFMA